MSERIESVSRVARRGRSAAVAAALGALLLLPPAAAAATPAGGDLSAPLVAAMGSVLEAYEAVRAELAADRMEGVGPGAERLASALREARAELDAPDRAEAPADLALPLDEAVAAASALAGATDLPEARRAFGAVSRGLLLVAGRDERLTAGRHVFSCPMAEGFGRWIQKSAEMANPYMGTAMLQCGAAIDWNLPGADPSAPPVRSGLVLSGERLELEPGIPDLRMEDVRDHKFLWREIDELASWEHGDRITVAEYRSKVVEKTAHFLGLGVAAADELAAVATVEVAAIRAAFRDRPETGGATSGVEGRFSSDLAAATARVTALLGDEPRHQLFAPETKRWLLKLAFSPREAKERQESAAATGDDAGNGA